MLKVANSVISASRITGVLPVVNGGTGVTTSTGTGNTVLSAAPTLSGNVTLSTGNLIIGTSGKGIDFSATPGTGTSELLADYEEGIWTPSVSSGATISASEGWYTKIGRMVYCYGYIRTTEITTNIALGGLPFTSANYSTGYDVSSVTSSISVAVTSVNSGRVSFNSTTFSIPITTGYTGSTIDQFFALWYQAA